MDCLQDEKYCVGLLDKRQGLQMQFFTHAYAQGVLPSPIQMSSPYDFAISAFQVVLQVLFIALIILWLYAGFSLVIARGNPTELEKAKNRLWYSFFITVILMLIQALLIGLAGTVGVTISK